jgi:hypothetical protein
VHAKAAALNQHARNVLEPVVVRTCKHEWRKRVLAARFGIGAAREEAQGDAAEALVARSK